MESTWEQRELPVLDAVVRYFAEHDGRLIPQVGDIAALTGLDVVQVAGAARALDPTYLEFQMVSGRRPELYHIVGVTDAARRAVGQRPTPDLIADRIVAGLLEAADREPDEGRRTKLKVAGEALGGFARDVPINAAANLATKPIGL